MADSAKPIDETQTSRQVLRSVGAVLSGFIANVVFSLGTDLLLVVAGIYPPLTQSGAFTSRLLAIATAYRIVYGVLSGYVTARLAPAGPMLHALILGGIGLAASLAGAILLREAGPAWYPWALVVLALPTSWLGGKFHVMQREKS